jgi:Putative adhesin
MSAATEPAPAFRTPAAVRRALFLVGALLALFLVIVGAYNLIDVASRHTKTERASYDGVRSLTIEDASDVRMLGVPAGAALAVETRITEGLRTPETSVEHGPGGELMLSSSCGGILGGECSVDYTINVPAGTVLRVDADAGDVVAERIETTEPLVLDTSAGDIEAFDVKAPSIELSSSAGDVKASGLSAERIELHSSAGDVEASIATPPQRLRAESSAGDVELLVPDVTYDLSASSSAGDVDARVASDPDSNRELTAHSSAGDVRVAVRP